MASTGKVEKVVVGRVEDRLPRGRGGREKSYEPALGLRVVSSEVPSMSTALLLPFPVRTDTPHGARSVG